MLTQEHVQAVKHGVDGAAVAVAVGGLMGYAPQIAALAATLWYALQAYILIKDRLNKKRTKTRRETDK